MPTDLPTLELAVTPSLHDVAIASEVILGLLAGGYHTTGQLFEPVLVRLADEALPDVAKTMAGVQESDLRRVRAAAATMTAVAHLDARGAILPMGPNTYYTEAKNWDVRIASERSPSSLRIDGPFNFGIAAGYKLPTYERRTPLIDSPAVFLHNLPPLMGDKVRRILLEAVDAYRSGLYFATAVLLGVASEAAWGQIARSLLEQTHDSRLGELIDNPRTGAAEIQARVIQLVRPMRIRGFDYDLSAMDAAEQAYRDVRNYAVHRPDESFDETRVARPAVGLLLDGTVDYYRRLYELNDRVKAP